MRVNIPETMHAVMLTGYGGFDKLEYQTDGYQRAEYSHERGSKIPEGHRKTRRGVDCEKQGQMEWVACGGTQGSQVSRLQSDNNQARSQYHGFGLL